MHTAETLPLYNGAQQLAILAGWQPLPRPAHRALEAEALEMQDLAERDHAARVAFARRAAP